MCMWEHEKKSKRIMQKQKRKKIITILCSKSCQPQSKWCKYSISNFNSCKIWTINPQQQISYLKVGSKHIGSCLSLNFCSCYVLVKSSETKHEAKRSKRYTNKHTDTAQSECVSLASFRLIFCFTWLHEHMTRVFDTYRNENKSESFNVYFWAGEHNNKWIKS